MDPRKWEVTVLLYLSSKCQVVSAIKECGKNTAKKKKPMCFFFFVLWSQVHKHNHYRIAPWVGGREGDKLSDLSFFASCSLLLGSPTGQTKVLARC